MACERGMAGGLPAAGPCVQLVREPSIHPGHPHGTLCSSLHPAIQRPVCDRFAHLSFLAAASMSRSCPCLRPPRRHPHQLSIPVALAWPPSVRRHACLRPPRLPCRHHARLHRGLHRVASHARPWADERAVADRQFEVLARCVGGRPRGTDGAGGQGGHWRTKRSSTRRSTRRSTRPQQGARIGYALGTGRTETPTPAAR